MNKLPHAYRHIARYIPSGQLESIINGVVKKSANDVDASYLIFKEMQQGIAQRGAKETEQLKNWGITIAGNLLNKYPDGTKKSGDVNARQKFAVELAGNYKLNALESKLQTFLAPASNADNDVKTAALRSLLKIAPQKNAALASHILYNENTPIDIRKRVANVLGDFASPAVYKVLGDVKNAPPELQAAIAIALAGSAQGKDIIFNMVKKGTITPRTLIEPKVEERILLGISSKQKSELDQLTAGLEPVSKERQELIDTRLAGFHALKEKPPVDSGKIVFIKNCSPCHTVKNEGGKIGPQLDGVGQWGAKALAEKVLDPNRNVSEAFKNYTIKLKDGKVMSGLYRRDAGEVMVFADIAGQEFSVPKNDIAERTASKYTLMPDQFGQVLSENDFNALINFLLHQKD